MPGKHYKYTDQRRGVEDRPLIQTAKNGGAERTEEGSQVTFTIYKCEQGQEGNLRYVLHTLTDGR